MRKPVIKSPGVYINESNVFPTSVAPVATAVPAFVGYTPQAEYRGKSCLNKPIKVSSMAEFKAIFMLPDPPAPADPAKQYKPEYYLLAEKSEPDSGAYLNIGGTYYSVLPDPNTIYYLYNSIRLFYQNGGGDAYIVSVGNYGPPSNKPMPSASAHIANPNVLLTELAAGLATLKDELEPTMYICPEATLLSVRDNATLMQAMLLQAKTMGTAMCIFDIIGGKAPDPVSYIQDVETFRSATGYVGLDYGVCYYPFVGTNMMQPGEMDYTQLFGGDIKQLEPLLNPPANPNTAAAYILGMITKQSGQRLPVSKYNAELLAASKTYNRILNLVLKESNILPPSGGMAGVYTLVDNSAGVWKAPANVAIAGVVDLPFNITHEQQESLNVDPRAGKSVNAIRSFVGEGTLVWGARTLDGNSLDWRYVPVRRTINMLEQSAKLAIKNYVFEPNDTNTWSTVKNMLSSLLNNIWRAGGLAGAKPADAYQVRVGVGETMTEADVLAGRMRVNLAVAITRPAEFIVITLEQKMAISS